MIHLPTLNAFLNGTAGILLILGWRAIKKGNQTLHRKYMIAAFFCSCAFLISYLTYHLTTTGITPYKGQGIWRAVYFFVLGTHTPLAVLIVPFILAALRFALKGNFSAHTRITRWLFPTWLYVSITGVVIYLMLYVFS